MEESTYRTLKGEDFMSIRMEMEKGTGKGLVAGVAMCLVFYPTVGAIGYVLGHGVGCLCERIMEWHKNR